MSKPATLGQIAHDYATGLAIINRLRVSNVDLLASLKALRANPGLHESCSRFDVEGSDNMDVIEVDDRCEECRAADRAIAQAEAGARSPGVTTEKATTDT